MHYSQFLRALTLGIALGSLFASTLTATPAQAGASILVEADSGKVLRQENATYPWYPASVTKLMTLYATLQAVKQGRITLDTLFTVSRNALAQAPTKMGFGVGTQVTVDNALKMMMVKSANDMAVLLAEGVDGSIENFADDMTRTAHRLGMTESNFVNPNGLPADGQITSARDLAILARALIHDFPEYNYYWHIPAIKFGRRVIRNYNKLLGRYPGADGMKTGFICASGFNLVATATRGNKQLIAVVLGAPSSAARAVKAAELLESGFTQNPLSWLTPALGQVDKTRRRSTPTRPICTTKCADGIASGRRRRTRRTRPAARGGVDTPFSALLSSLRAPTPKGAALLSDFGAVTPTVVYTGPTRTPAQLANLASARRLPIIRKEARRRPRRRSPPTRRKRTRKPRTRKVRTKKPKPKRTQPTRKPALIPGRRRHPRRWRQARLPDWRRNADADAPKKRHKTKPPIKPTAAQ